MAGLTSVWRVSDFNRSLHEIRYDGLVLNLRIFQGLRETQQLPQALEEPDEVAHLVGLSAEEEETKMAV